MKFFRLSNINQSVTYSNQPKQNDWSTTLFYTTSRHLNPAPVSFLPDLFSSMLAFVSEPQQIYPSVWRM